MVQWNRNRSTIGIPDFANYNDWCRHIAGSALHKSTLPADVILGGKEVSVQWKWLWKVKQIVFLMVTHIPYLKVPFSSTLARGLSQNIQPGFGGQVTAGASSSVSLGHVVGKTEWATRLVTLRHFIKTNTTGDENAIESENTYQEVYLRTYYFLLVLESLFLIFTWRQKNTKIKNFIR